MPEVLNHELVVGSFGSADALEVGLQAKANFQDSDLYPRDGSTMLGVVEGHIAQLADVDGARVLSYTSGMSAVSSSIDIGLDFAAEGPHADLPVVACSTETYTGTKRYLERFVRGKRARVVYFESGDPAAVERTLEGRQPDVVVVETVGNAINTPVLDVDALLEQTRSMNKQPYVVLDNTLPLSTALPLGVKLRPDERVVVADSGTKAIGLNAKLLGVAYTKNEEVQSRLLPYRRYRGEIYDASSLTTVAEVMPHNKEAFDERNWRLYRSTAQIAVALATELAGSRDFIVVHPALPDHDNHGYYAEHYPDGATPVFYVQTPNHSQLDVLRMLEQSQTIMDQADGEPFSQSFGFANTRFVHDETTRAFRIAGGAETDGTTLGLAIAEALKDGVRS